MGRSVMSWATAFSRLGKFYRFLNLDTLGTSIFISTMTLTAIAIDRYLVIVHHSQSTNINDRMSMRVSQLFSLRFKIAILFLLKCLNILRTSFIIHLNESNY